MSFFPQRVGGGRSGREELCWHRSAVSFARSSEVLCDLNAQCMLNLSCLFPITIEFDVFFNSYGHYCGTFHTLVQDSVFVLPKLRLQ